MKKLLQSFLQKLLGFERYLFWFSRFKIATLRRDKKEGDFIHFLSLLPPDANVLDIGANIGIMTVLLARQCPRGKVWGFEPIPENFRALNRIVRHYKLDNVELLQMALGEEKGELEMVMPELESVRMQGLSHVVHDSIEGFGGGTTYKVPVEPLDTLPAFAATRVHGIKIDVENFEQFAFRGAKNLLKRERPIVYAELWANENRDNCFALFRELDYQISVLIAGKMVAFDPKKHEKQNFFFIP